MSVKACAFPQPAVRMRLEEKAIGRQPDLKQRRRLYFGFTRHGQRQAGSTIAGAQWNSIRQPDRVRALESGLGGCRCSAVAKQSPDDRFPRRLPVAGPAPGRVLAARGEQAPPLPPTLRCWSNCREAAFAGCWRSAWAARSRPCEPLQDTLHSSSSTCSHALW